MNCHSLPVEAANEQGPKGSSQLHVRASGGCVQLRLSSRSGAARAREEGRAEHSPEGRMSGAPVFAAENECEVRDRWELRDATRKRDGDPALVTVGHCGTRSCG